MSAILPLAQMSTADKLRALEELWADLSLDPANVPVPAWHGETLRGREQRIEEGVAAFSEWDAVKQRLRDTSR